MNYGKVEEPSSSRSRSPSTARYAATSAILTAISSKSDRAPTSRTVSARPGRDADLIFEDNFVFFRSRVFHPSVFEGWTEMRRQTERSLMKNEEDVPFVRQVPPKRTTRSSTGFVE